MTRIKNWLLTGDTHGKVADRLANIPDTYKPEETAIIILGDSGFNFWLNNTDRYTKKAASKFGYTIYCVRGNHEERPSNIEGMELIYDNNVKNMVWTENEFPLIRYFCEGATYFINGYTALPIGGAYSVDKEYRLARAGLTEETNDPKKSGWFQSEQLTAKEMALIDRATANQKYDFVFTHTCPYSWEPCDLFLSFIDQSKVDNTMEKWLDELKESFDWGVWCFGHFHADRTERECVEQFYYRIENIEDIWRKWNVGSAD